MPVSSPSYFPPARSNGSIIGITAGQGAIGASDFLAGRAAGEWTDLDDLIVIGEDSFIAGTSTVRVSDALLDGTIVIGADSAKAITTGGTGATIAQGANLCIGRNVMPLVTTARDNVLIGEDVGKVWADNLGQLHQRNTIIGAHAMRNVAGAGGTSVGGMVVMGAFACNNGTAGTSTGTYTNSVVIGSQAMSNAMNSGQTFSTSVIIGFGACTDLQSTTNAVAIGNLCADNCGNITGSILIGSGLGTGGRNSLASVHIGTHQDLAGDRNTFVGAGMGVNQALADSIMIGQGCTTANIASSGITLIEQNISGVGLRSSVYAESSSAGGTNIILGNSSGSATARSFSTNAQNIIKLLSGSSGSTNPTGGGYFYVDGLDNNNLHWVNSAGSNVNLTGGGTFGGFANPTATIGLTAVNGAASTALRSDGAPALSQAITPTWTGTHTFTPESIHTGGIRVGTTGYAIASNVAFTDGAGAAIGTLLNAPVAGDPTKWIAIDDNGTLRYIPAW